MKHEMKIHGEKEKKSTYSSPHATAKSLLTVDHADGIQALLFLHLQRPGGGNGFTLWA